MVHHRLSEVIYSAPVSTDYLTVYLSGCETSSQTGVSAIVGDAYSGYDTAAVITGSVTIVMDPGMEISSDQTSDTGLFGASGSSGSGSSMITLGFDGDDNQFYTGSVISFDVDDYTISYTVTNGLDDASTPRICTTPCQLCYLQKAMRLLKTAPRSPL